MLEIKVERRKWQAAYYTLFSSPKGQVNLSFEVGNPWMVPSGAREPKDYDEVLPGYTWLAINHSREMRLEFVAPEDEGYEPVDLAEATLFGAFLESFRWWYREEGEHRYHHKMLHPSWYPMVEE